MARLHSRSKGSSHSVRPTSKRVPPWITYSLDEIVTMIVKMGKDGMNSSEIGVRLRDEYGIPLVKSVLAKSITQILHENGVQRALPEDLDNLLAQAKGLQEHLSKHRGDRKNVRSFELLEAKIHRLSKYYKRIGLLPRDWKYSAVVAQLA